MKPAVLISIVTWNSAAEIGRCLQSLREQTWRDFQLGILDNASHDDTLAAVKRSGVQPDHLVLSPVNLGYSAGHNRVLALSDSPYVLFLNPDTALAPDFLERAVDRLAGRPECGSLAPRLLRMADVGQGVAPQPILDTTGMYWIRSQRHFDRGSGETAEGRYLAAEYVFGASGAAAFYRRTCLDDVAFRGEVWDEDFFAYREDADLAWRAAWRGWRCLYDPAVTAQHVRKVTPRGRGNYAAAVNRHSVKNRFLLRLKNMPLSLDLRFLPWILARDLCVIGGVFFWEWRSLPAFVQVLKLLPRFLAKRRHVLGRRRVSSTEMARWFTQEAFPLKGFGD